jgi:hypothetical protein
MRLLATFSVALSIAGVLSGCSMAPPPSAPAVASAQPPAAAAKGCDGVYDPVQGTNWAPCPAAAK